MRYRRKQDDEYEFEPIEGSKHGACRVWRISRYGDRSCIGTIEAAGIEAYYEPLPEAPRTEDHACGKQPGLCESTCKPEEATEPARCGNCNDAPESSLVRVDCSTCGKVIDCQQCAYRHIDHFHTLELIEVAAGSEAQREKDAIRARGVGGKTEEGEGEGKKPAAL